MARRRTRFSFSEGFGPFRFGISVPLTRKGKTYLRAGVRAGRRGYASVSTPVGGKRRSR